MDITHTICNIKVVGVGGGGNNAVNRMVAAGITGVHFVAVNTDKQDLLMSNADEIIQIGKDLTKGLGAGANPEMGRRAAEESKEELQRMLQGTDLLFITTGMGGGTGTGAAPVIAKLAKEMGILTIGVVTKPFRFEAKTREKNANEGIEEMRKYVDSLVIIPNEKLYTILKKDVPFVDAFRYADDVLRQAIQGVSDVIAVPGLINLDFADVATIMRQKGIAHMGVGKGRGANKTIEAVRQAVTSQLLETSIEGATGILINITGGRDLTMAEVYEAVDLVRDVADNDCNVIFGAKINNDSSGETEITVIATGFDMKDKKEEEATPNFKDNSAQFKVFTAQQFAQNDLSEPNQSQMQSQTQQSTTPSQNEIDKTDVKSQTAQNEEKKVGQDTVEDISIASKRPIINDDDIPPFLRKLKK